jgi:hypothetical protein
VVFPKINNATANHQTFIGHVHRQRSIQRMSVEIAMISSSGTKLQLREALGAQPWASLSSSLGLPGYSWLTTTVLLFLHPRLFPGENH